MGSSWSIDDQWMVGNTLLVKPVTEAGKTNVDVYFPADSKWYDILDGRETILVQRQGQTVSIPAPLDKIPVFIKGGSILPQKMRLRRSASLMYHDPFTITVAPNTQGNSHGTLYLDDEKTLAHESIASGGRENFVYRDLSFDGTSLNCKAFDESKTPAFMPRNLVERVIL